jgi:regulator of protease activity HflC (stomatin/prohibitin superfamily)
VAIAEFNARATVKSAEGAGQAKKINAEADANVLRTVGDAQAAKTKAVGAADAEVIRLKINGEKNGLRQARRSREQTRLRLGR